MDRSFPTPYPTAANPTFAPPLSTPLNGVHGGRGARTTFTTHSFLLSPSLYDFLSFSRFLPFSLSLSPSFLFPRHILPPAFSNGVGRPRATTTSSSRISPLAPSSCHLQPSNLRFSTYRMLRHSGEIYGYFTKWLNALPDYGAGEGGEREKAANDRQRRRLRYRRLSATVNCRGLSSFLATIDQAWNSHFSLFFYFFYPSSPPFPPYLLQDTLLVPRHFSRLRSRVVAASFSTSPPPSPCLTSPSLLPRSLSSLVEIIRKMGVFLP